MASHPDGFPHTSCWSTQKTHGHDRIIGRGENIDREGKRERGTIYMYIYIYIAFSF